MAQTPQPNTLLHMNILMDSVRRVPKEVLKAIEKLVIDNANWTGTTIRAVIDRGTIENTIREKCKQLNITYIHNGMSDHFAPAFRAKGWCVEMPHSTSYLFTGKMDSCD